MANLCLAICWLALGAGLLAWHWVCPDKPELFLLGTNLPSGWVALLFGLYKLARWWSSRGPAAKKK